MEYLIFIPALSWVIIEAAYGDRHRVSVVVFHILFCLLLAAALPFTNWWQGIAACIATRIWFDYIHNAFTGVWWGYLGETAATDKILRNFDAYGLFVARVIVFCGSLIIFNATI
jgi:hypothetical protein